MGWINYQFLFYGILHVFHYTAACSIYNNCLIQTRRNVTTASLAIEPSHIIHYTLSHITYLHSLQPITVHLYTCITCTLIRAVRKNITKLTMSLLPQFTNKYRFKLYLYQINNHVQSTSTVYIWYCHSLDW